jgi:deazaflavin-dependent oxidoreductase (nitroreductase family)
MSEAEEIFLYLTTVGRKSGLPRQIEIWFVQHAERYYVVAERREQAHWVQNIQQAPRVQFSVGRRDDRGAVLPLSAAQARLVADDEPIAVQVRALMDAKYGWSDGLIVELRRIAP